MAKRSPPMPFMVGSTTARTAAAVTAASIALPPDCRTRSPAAVASGWLVAMAPLRAMTTERVPRVLPAGRSPAGCCIRRPAKVMATRIRMSGSYRSHVRGSGLCLRLRWCQIAVFEIWHHPGRKHRPDPRSRFRLGSMSIRHRVARLVAELPQEAQYPTQGATVFVDLERREVRRGYTPLHVVRSLLAARGAHMFYLHPLLDEPLQTVHPVIPMLFGSSLLTGIVTTAGRGSAAKLASRNLKAVVVEGQTGDFETDDPSKANTRRLTQKLHDTSAANQARM